MRQCCVKENVVTQSLQHSNAVSLYCRHWQSIKADSPAVLRSLFFHFSFCMAVLQLHRCCIRAPKQWLCRKSTLLYVLGEVLLPLSGRSAS